MNSDSETTKPFEDHNSTLHLDIIGAKCAGCVSKIEQKLSALEGISSAQVNFADRTAEVTGQASADDIISAIRSIGYDATEIVDEETAQQAKEAQEEKEYHQLLSRTWLSLGGGLLLMLWGIGGGKMAITTPLDQAVWLAVGAVTLGIMYVCGKHFYSGAWRAFFGHSANMDTLIALGTGSAWFFSMIIALLPSMFPESSRHVYFEATLMIIGLVNLGQALEIRARGKTSAAIKHLLGLQPKIACVIRNGEEFRIPVTEIILSDKVKIRPGEKIPVDGKVESGESYVEESMLTGEPVPAKKSIGDTVAAGTINNSGSLTVAVTHTGRNTLLAQIIQQVKQAQNSKPDIGKLADKVSAVFVPSVIIIAILAALIWFNFGPAPVFSYMLIAAMTVLIIACPCALGLATPMAIMMGVGKAAQLGVLIRKGDALQTSGKLDTLVIDKTGTITEGRPAVMSLMTSGRYDQDKLIQLAASLENASEHPLARAIVKEAALHKIELFEPSSFESISGKGIKGDVNNHHVVIGTSLWLEENAIDSTPLARFCHVIADKGSTPVLVAIDGKAIGALSVGDPIKDDSASAIKRLKDKGLHVIMLSGDRKSTAESIAKQVGVDEVIAEVLPDEKAKVIKELVSQDKKVGMVGDGINDAPALAHATVGFAMGNGTDVAIESADMALMRSSLHGVADAIEISNATVRNIKQNLGGAFIYNIVGIPVAAGILYPITGTLLSPVIAGAAMSLSSLTVVSNANRLRWFTPSYIKPVGEENALGNTVG